MKKLFAVFLVAVALACCCLVGCNGNQPEPKTRTVSFDSRGGSAVASQSVLEGGKINLPNAPTRNGYILNGWYASPLSTADTEWHFDTDCVTQDLTLYAGWTEIPNVDEQEVTKMYLTIDGNKIEVELAENSSVDALVEILKQGDIVYTANDYGGFEKVGSLGHTLPTDNSQITTQAGDVILYSGNQIVLFYGSNSWSYTRLGTINGYSVNELRDLLRAGKGSVQVTISLN